MRRCKRGLQNTKRASVCVDVRTACGADTCIVGLCKRFDDAAGVMSAVVRRHASRALMEADRCGSSVFGIIGVSGSDIGEATCVKDVVRTELKVCDGCRVFVN